MTTSAKTAYCCNQMPPLTRSNLVYTSFSYICENFRQCSAKADSCSAVKVRLNFPKLVTPKPSFNLSCRDDSSTWKHFAMLLIYPPCVCLALVNTAGVKAGIVSTHIKKSTMASLGLFYPTCGVKVPTCGVKVRTCTNFCPKGGYYTPWNYNLEMSLLGISSTPWN
ncbi:hypothetical protein NQ317_006726 [Molorchus minor]|uniref:Uncharacterized protein n=1 Tax=Molorchus minor TaxID=1323400 RepID=A0ABQ9IYX6_9CUCU|nr:hypothetical protein NQ317_006726 [Molorchus minor]